MADNYNNAANFAARKNDEVSVLMTKNCVVSLAPRIKGADTKDVYKMLDQDHSSIQIRLAPYGPGIQGKRCVFNISLTQAQSLYETVKQSMIFNIGDWDFSEKWGGKGSLDKIFGNPDPAHNNKSMVRRLILKRQPVMPDGRPARLPWFIQIQNGYGTKLQSQTGGFYMASGSFEKESEAMVRLSDGQMYELFYWSEHLFNLFFEATRNNVLVGHQQISQQSAPRVN